MPRLRISRPFAAIAFAAVVACTSATDVCGCSPYRGKAARVFGQVTDAAGAPVAGARVTVLRGLPGCAQAIDTMGWVITPADGRYGTVVYEEARPIGNDCLRVIATPAPGSTLRASDAVGFTVPFQEEVRMDSVRVDLVLRAP